MNPCGYTHPKNQPCRLCDAELAWRRRKSSDQSKPVIAVIRAEEIPTPVVKMSVQHDPNSFGEVKKPERIEVAKAAIDEGAQKSAMSAAKKQRRYRENHPEYREREAERHRARRAKIRGSPKSPEE